MRASVTPPLARGMTDDGVGSGALLGRLDSRGKCYSSGRWHIGNCTEERYHIAALRREGHSAGAIARELGRHHSTVSREVKRNATPYDGAYRPSYAKDMKSGRHRRSRRNARYGPMDFAPVEAPLTQRWSPKQIVGRRCVRGPRKRLDFKTPHAVYHSVLLPRPLGRGLRQALRLLSSAATYQLQVRLASQPTLSLLLPLFDSPPERADVHRTRQEIPRRKLFAQAGDQPRWGNAPRASQLVPGRRSHATSAAGAQFALYENSRQGTGFFWYRNNPGYVSLESVAVAPRTSSAPFPPRPGSHPRRVSTSCERIFGSVELRNLSRANVPSLPVRVRPPCGHGLQCPCRAAH